MCMGAAATSNPLVQASRYQVWKLARHAYPRLRDGGDAAARIDLCAASLLQNRDEEDGGRPLSCDVLEGSLMRCCGGVPTATRD